MSGCGFSAADIFWVLFFLGELGVSGCGFSAADISSRFDSLNTAVIFGILGARFCSVSFFLFVVSFLEESD